MWEKLSIISSLMDFPSSQEIPALKFSYHDWQTFSAPRWDCHPQGLYHIEGANGSGKSTYLKILVNLLSCWEPLFIGHDLGVIPELSVRWHQLFYAFKSRLAQPALPQEPLLSFSQGQQKIFALQAHLGFSRKIWVLDEPFNTLDRTNRQHLSEIFEKHRASGGVIILTDHEQNLLRNSQKIQLQSSEVSCSAQFSL